VATEQTLILVKPDGVARGIVGEVIARIERKGFVLRALELRTLEREVAEEHYAEHTERPFFGDLVDFITSGPLVAMCVEGDDAIKGMRQIMGATNPIEAAPGSIRGDFATVIGENIVHGSDSPESAARELGIFFPGRF
jgi:nucleoside-diphosphate kinase